MVKNNLINRIYFILIEILTCISIIVILLRDNIEKYKNLVLLPISFFILSLMFSKIYKLIGKSITFTNLIALMFIKNVVTPTMMSLGNGFFLSQTEIIDKMFSAIILEIYEEIVIFGILYFRYNRMKKYIKLSEKINYSISKEKRKYIGVIGIVIILIILIILYFYPLLKIYNTTVIYGEVEDIVKYNQLQTLAKVTTPKFFYYLYMLCIDIIRWLGPLILICYCYTSKYKVYIKVLISFLIIIPSVILVTDTIAISIFIALSYSMVIVRLYPKYQQKIFLILSVIIGGLSSIFFILKNFNSLIGINFDKIAFIFQAYFSGPENVAIGLKISTNLTLKEIIGDIFKFIPYVSYFFKDFPSSNGIFNYIYFGNSQVATQIIPMISQGERYFGIILAPIFTLVIINYIILNEIKGIKKRKILECIVSIITGVCLSMGSIMYNASLCLLLYLKYIFPIQIIIKIIQKISYKRSEKKF